MRWWVFSVLALWTALSGAVSKDLREESHRNLIEAPDYDKSDSALEEKGQYAPVLEDDPPVKEREAPCEKTNGLTLPEGKESVIDPAPDYDRTPGEIAEESN